MIKEIEKKHMGDQTEELSKKEKHEAHMDEINKLPAKEEEKQ